MYMLQVVSYGHQRKSVQISSGCGVVLLEEHIFSLLLPCMDATTMTNGWLRPVTGYESVLVYRKPVHCQLWKKKQPAYWYATRKQYILNVLLIPGSVCRL